MVVVHKLGELAETNDIVHGFCRRSMLGTYEDNVKSVYVIGIQFFFIFVE